jgi:hypothetical protein
MRSSLTATLLFCLLVVPGSAKALELAFFDNPAYTDSAGEVANLAASLTALGHTLKTFSGITEADWQAATTDANVLVIPELELATLFGDLDAAAQSAITSYVNNGGGLLTFGTGTFFAEPGATLNGLFAFSLVNGGIVNGDSTLNASAAAGTAFAGGPATLPGTSTGASAVSGFTTASLPTGALSLYEDGAGNTTVFTVAVSSGRVGFLGFDWFETPPSADWEQVLGSALTETAGAAGDHYQCYKAKDLKNPKFAKQLGVSVADQFTTATIDLKKPDMVCAPTDKDGSGIVDEATHLCCYKSTGPKLSDAEDIETEDQFGTLQLQLKKAKMLCAPCTKDLLP